jgi:ATP sulfurylase
MTPSVITRLDNVGVDIFRINLSHTAVQDVAAVINKIKKHTQKPICIDTEGAQIRTSYMVGDRVELNDNSHVEIVSGNIVGNAQQISLNYPQFIAKLRAGDLVSIDFNSVLLQVLKPGENSVVAKVISGGIIGSNKAVSLDRYVSLPFITEKDKSAVEIALGLGVDHFALSFASDRESVEQFRKLVGKDNQIISKIESKIAISNLGDILSLSDAILIDRGDLSKEVPIQKIPFVQKLIINEANKHKVPVYVATNLLESMVTSKKPTRAEANDVVNTIIDGADGLVLAAETAIGKYPVSCAYMISELIKSYYDHNIYRSLEEFINKESFMLVEPHGGKLIDRTFLDQPKVYQAEHKKISVDLNDILNAEQIAIGTFSPLEGFMTKKELESVLIDYKMPDGVVWPIPILLQLKQSIYKNILLQDRIALVLEGTEDIYAFLTVNDKFTYDLDKLALETFGTTNQDHPGVAYIHQKDGCFIGGKIELVKRLPSPNKHYELTPRQVRTIFEHKGWSRVVGFHTRNAVHRVHEHIQLEAMRKYHADGLFIHPVVGPKKTGDYEADVILDSYEILLDKYYPKGKVLLAAFQNYSRYCGPREAVFTALCRKNFGCSHFIVGRDHTGVGNYYQPEDAHRLFEKLGDIGIVPVFFNEMHYCQECKEYVDACKHAVQDIQNISGTRGREMLMNNVLPPAWFMREEVSQMIIDKFKAGKEVFVK